MTNYMANAIGQSATDLAPSSLTEERFPWNEVAEKLLRSTYPVNNKVRERCKVNLAGLKLMIAKAFIDQSGGVYTHKQKLPANIWALVSDAAYGAMKSKMAEFVTLDNVQTFRREFKIDTQHGVTERVIAIGENSIALREQRLALTIAIGDCSRSIADGVKRGTLTSKRAAQLHKRIQDLEFLEMKLATEEQNQAPLQAIVAAELQK